MNNFNDFIFNSKLEKQLKWLVDNPKKIPPVLCFFGNPGNGKSSFANYLAKEIGVTTQYFDMNEYMENGKSSGQILERIKMIVSTGVLGDFSKTWKKVIILDEFHNATFRQQDSLKTILERYSANNNCLFILCLNTKQGKGIDDVITPAIRSRVHPISFNTKKLDMPVLTKSVKDKFPMLKTEDIENNLPDMRRIQRMVAMS